MCRSQKPFSPSSSGKGLDHVGDSRSLHQGIHKNRKKERQRKEKKNEWVQSINRGRWIVSLQIHIEKEASEQIKRIHETAISQSQTVSNLEKACKHNKAKNRFESLFPGQKGTYKQSRIKLKKKKKLKEAWQPSSDRNFYVNYQSLLKQNSSLPQYRNDLVQQYTNHHHSQVVKGQYLQTETGPL